MPRGLGHQGSMTIDVLSALALFALITSITPGPNNLMLMASGANFGFARTVPHMMGITLGFMVMLLLVGFGLIRVFDAFPVIYSVLKILSLIYLIYLAYKIATAELSASGGVSMGQPQGLGLRAQHHHDLRALCRHIAAGDHGACRGGDGAAVGHPLDPSWRADGPFSNQSPAFSGV